MSSPSHRRRSENNQAEDQISNLPDAILSHILSYMPTKSALKTSILSKRWRYVWTKVPTLDFTEMPDSRPPHLLTRLQGSYFKSFVDKVLLHNEISYVQRVCLDLVREEDNFYVMSWLSAVARREAHEINISLATRMHENFRQPLPLPTQLLSSERIRVLKLHGFFAVNGTMSLHLPNLETMHLIGVQFPDDDFIKRLLSCCPALEELLLDWCYGITSRVYVESLTLKSLQIKGLKVQCVVIRAPSLRLLALHEYGYDVERYDIGELNSLVEANLEFQERDYIHAVKLLRRLCGVETLRFYIEECNGAYRSRAKLPMLRNLTCLKLRGDETAYKLLNCAPGLKSLIFEYLELADCEYFETHSVPKCISCLETIEFSNFYYIDDEFEGGTTFSEMMRLVAYFLKNAIVLKEMAIYLDNMHDLEVEIDVYQKLLMLPRSSSACQLKVAPRSET